MGQERAQKEEELKVKLHNEWQQFQQMNNVRQYQLDSAIDNYTKRFMESESAARHSISQMEEAKMNADKVLPTVSYQSFLFIKPVY